ncbi:MAG: hypothetical protein CL528_13360 [Aequorivita sp.]|jgi:hypothetical protein|nr:hypothetical protein [Aequorivita sp.]|tara:strand:+ start:5371 stop:5751 length:381 start_codon:yes stop_codon:yes gene_type:complete
MAIQLGLFYLLVTVGAIFLGIAFLGKSRAIVVIASLFFITAGATVGNQGIDTGNVEKWSVDTSLSDQNITDINKTTTVLTTTDPTTWFIWFGTFGGGIALLLISLVSFIGDKRSENENDEFSHFGS